MKKFIFLIIFLCMFTESHAEQGQLYDYRAFQSWSSYIFTDIDGPPVVRMYTTYNNGLALTIDFLSDKTYLLSVVEPTYSFLPSTNIDIEIRIDTNNIIRCQGMSSTNKGYLWLNIALPRNTTFLQQAIYGNILRFRIMPQNPLYLKFTLDGFAQAYNHAMDLCRKLYNNYNNDDEEYFNGKVKYNNQDDIYCNEI